MHVAWLRKVNCRLEKRMDGALRVLLGPSSRDNVVVKQLPCLLTRAFHLSCFFNSFPIAVRQHLHILSSSVCWYYYSLTTLGRVLVLDHCPLSSACKVACEHSPTPHPLQQHQASVAAIHGANRTTASQVESLLGKLRLSCC